MPNKLYLQFLEIKDLPKIKLHQSGNYTSAEIEANRAAWLVALRSELFPQGHCHLYGIMDGACCLGVAHVITPEISAEMDDNDTYRFIYGKEWSGSNSLMIRPLQLALGLDDADPFVRRPEPKDGRIDAGKTLTDLNDIERLEFKVIAEYVEQDVFPNYPLKDAV